MLMDLAKRAIPALAGFYLTRIIVSKLGPMLPAALGSLQGPVTAAVSIVGLNYATTKVAFLARHRAELMMGAAVSALDALFQAFAPASVKAMVGVGDYIQMGDYIAVGGAPPLNDRMTLSDYIAVGGDGVEEELGMGVEEELGVEEDLGNDMLGGMPGGASLMKRVPTQSFVSPIPARSFTKQIPDAGTSYDNAGQLYGGVFAGGFGR
jgi:hypothetical protein